MYINIKTFEDIQLIFYLYLSGDIYTHKNKDTYREKYKAFLSVQW